MGDSISGSGGSVSGSGGSVSLGGSAPDIQKEIDSHGSDNVRIMQ